MSTENSNPDKGSNDTMHTVCCCPVCKSKNIKDISKYSNNGILGPGRRSWKISDTRECQECGVHFKPIKDNCI